MDPNRKISSGELQILAEARAANEHWYGAMLIAAEVMTERRRKWSGGTNPFANFIRYARMLGITVQESFTHMQALKWTRDMDSQSSNDSQLDTDIDKTNYAALAAGWRIMSPVEKMACQLEVGVWIDSQLLADWTLIDGPQD